MGAEAFPNMAGITEGLASLAIGTMAGQAQPPWANFVMTEQSDEKTVNYAWLGRIPQMREWTNDAKKIQTFIDGKYSLTSKPWELTIGIDKFDFRKGKASQMIRNRIKELAIQSVLHPTVLLRDLVTNGTDATEGLCFDGTAFFGDTHTAYFGSTQDNKLASQGTALAEIASDYWLAYTALIGFKDTTTDDTDAQVIMRPNPDIWIICPIELQPKFKQLQSFDKIGSTEYNLKDQFKLLPLHLSDSADWYMFDLARPMKPFIFQVTDPLTFGQVTDASRGAGEIGPERGMEFLGKNYYFGTEGLYVMGYGDWKDAVAVV